MAIKALNTSSVRDYTSVWDSGDDPTIWKIGSLTARDIGVIRDSVTSFSFGKNDEGGIDAGDVDTKIERSKMWFEAVRRGLKGWDNFLDPQTDKPIPFKTIKRDLPGGIRSEIVPNELLDLIPLKIIEELADQIMEGNTMEAEEVKN